MPEQQVFFELGAMAPMAQRRPSKSYRRPMSGSTEGLKVPMTQLAGM
jgi:hypothetical protein